VRESRQRQRERWRRWGTQRGESLALGEERVT
jgi:hypothetical protein